MPEQETYYIVRPTEGAVREGARDITTIMARSEIDGMIVGPGNQTYQRDPNDPESEYRVVTMVPENMSRLIRAAEAMTAVGRSEPSSDVLDAVAEFMTVVQETAKTEAVPA